ncbi:ead/Ea22-like family protein [Escherichia coli]|nr:ead/Ea22-like family protein [Escherichia coli]
MTNKQALRERYSEKPAPKCHICGSVMTIQRAGGGSVVCGCTGRIDTDGEGYKFESGRDFADDHYARSRVTDYSPSGDPEVLALLDELEAMKRANAAQDSHINQQRNRIDQLEKGHSEAAKQINSWRKLAKQNIAERETDLSELDIALKRIAELEAREVNLPKAQYVKLVTGEFIHAYPAYGTTVAIRAAGIRINGEG